MGTIGRRAHKNSGSKLWDWLAAGSDPSGQSEVNNDWRSYLYHLTYLRFFFQQGSSPSMNSGDATNVAVDWPKRAKKYNKDLNTAMAFVSIPSLLRLPHADVACRAVSSPSLPLPP